MARRATAIKEQREKATNILLLDAGNALFGQPLADKTRGRVIVEAMNKLGYQALALGDRDLNRGLDIVAERSKEASFPFLSANVTTRDGNKPIAKPYTVVTVDGRKIAIVGLTALTTAVSGSQQATLVEQDYLTAARATIEAARKEATAIIVLSNLGQAQENKLAAEVPGIAVIVGGGMGPRLPEPDTNDQTGTVILRTVGNGEELGVCELTIDAAGRAKDVHGQLITLQVDQFAEDPDMVKLLDGFQSN